MTIYISILCGFLSTAFFVVGSMHGKAQNYTASAITACASALWAIGAILIMKL